MTNPNDMIRRGDALAACEPRDYDHAHHRQAKVDCASVIAALPAVTMGVKPLPHGADELDAALAGYTAGIDRAVRFVTIDQVDALAEFYLQNRAALDLTPAPATQSFGTMICGRSGCGMSGPCMWEECEHPLATPDAQAAKLKAEIFRFLRDYRQTEVRDEDGYGYPLVDALTIDGCGIDMGEREIENIADGLAYELSQRPVTPAPAAQAADDPECTDCGGSGVTYQTERRCSCQPAPDTQAVRDATDASPNRAYRVGYAAGRAAALREAHDAIADYPRVAPDSIEAQHYDEQIEHCQSIILALIGKEGV